MQSKCRIIDAARQKGFCRIPAVLTKTNVKICKITSFCSRDMICTLHSAVMAVFVSSGSGIISAWRGRMGGKYRPGQEGFLIEGNRAR